MQTLPHVCSFIPRHIIERVAAHGDAADRDAMARTRARTERLQRRRGTEACTPRRRPSLRAFLRAQSSPGKLPKKRRYLHDAHHRETLPGELTFTESRPPGPGSDRAAREVWANSGTAFDFWSIRYDRNSFDGFGMPLHSSVHYGRQFANVLWDGKQTIYGDGDGKLFTSFTSALEVSGHEMSHGVIQYAVGLGYAGETGALNEHFADVFGVLIAQWARGEDASKADWLMGKGVFAPGVRGRAIRSMAHPGTAYDDPILGRDPQPAHMRDYVKTEADRGGVHINSGILNRAFYLVATAMGGAAWDGAGGIWYAVLTERLRPNSGFQEMADETYAETAEQYGARSREHRIVGDAFDAVGLPPIARSARIR